VISFRRFPWVCQLIFLFLSFLLKGQLFAQEDYLTEKEIAKLRDEFEDPSPRIELFRKFLNLRFDHAAAMKVDLVPAPAALSHKEIKEIKEDKKEKGKSSKKKNEVETSDEDGTVDERPNSFLGWIQQYTQCLEDIETNLGELSHQPVVLKPLLKVLKDLDADLNAQKIWVEQITPKLKGVEKKTLNDTGEVLRDLSPSVKSFIQKYEAQQEQMKKNKKFMLRLSEQDLQALRDVSQITKRSKSDVFRWALHEVANVLNSHPDRVKLLKQEELLYLMLLELKLTALLDNQVVSM